MCRWQDACFSIHWMLSVHICIIMMTSLNGNIFCVTGTLWGESTKASDAELWCFLWCAPEPTAEQTLEMLVNWNASELIVTSLQCKHVALQYVVFSSRWHAILQDVVQSIVSRVLSKHCHFPYGSWWRHQMERFSASLALCEGNPPVTGGFPPQKPAARRCTVIFDLRLSKRSRKQYWGRWFETPSRSLWRHRIVLAIVYIPINITDGIVEKA